MMDEPYVIGVRLALEDGVSGGMAQIGATLRATQAMAERLAAAMPLWNPPGKAPAFVSAAYMSAALMAQAKLAARHVLPQAPEVAEMAAPAEKTRETVFERMQSVTRDIETAPAAAPEAAPPLPGPQPVSRVVERLVRRIVPVAMPWSAEPARQAAQAPLAEPIMLPQREGRCEALSFAAPMAPSAAAPELQSAPAIAAPLAPALPSVAPVAEAGQEGGREGGAVYLDGMLVGRWMEERLARAAGRPSGGATGFDPRMGPSWPGALQGG